MAESVKKIVYTSIMGNYDQLKPPTVVSKNWEYVCFTDDQYRVSDVWNMVYVDSEEHGQAKTARMYKILNDKYLDCDLSMWVDGSFEIKCYLDEFVENYHVGNFSLMTHGRNCAYDEAEACIKHGKDRDVIIQEQMKGYKNEGFPLENGMVATGLIIRKHNIENNVQFGLKWWDEVRGKSKRDQLSFNYTAWKHPIDYHLMDFDKIIKTYFGWGKHNGV